MILRPDNPVLVQAITIHPKARRSPLDKLRKLLSYNKETGAFTWLVRVNSKVPAGSRAGAVNSRGYMTITFEGKKVLAHRLAWFFVHGVLPAGKLDHRNRSRTDNRLCNLREVTDQENALNQSARSDNTSGVRGVSYDSSRNKWRAHLTLCGKHLNLGRFNTKALAVAARRQGEIRHGVAGVCS